MTASGRAWLSGKMKILDPHRLIWDRGKSSVFSFMLAASGEAIITEDWFAKVRHDYLNQFISTDDGKDPKVFLYPKDKPQLAFTLLKGSISADGSCFRKELGLSGGSSNHNKCCLFCDVPFGMYRHIIIYYAISYCCICSGMVPFALHCY
jgi:hypothetical protein